MTITIRDIDPDDGKSDTVTISDDKTTPLMVDSTLPPNRPKGNNE